MMIETILNLSKLKRINRYNLIIHSNQNKISNLISSCNNKPLKLEINKFNNSNLINNKSSPMTCRI